MGTFDCMENLEDDLEWKLTYVGSAESSAHDQVLDTVYVGPVPEGKHMFVFQADPPDQTNIPVFDKLQRNILGSQPRVTKFKIDWDDAKDSENIPPSENAASDGASTSQHSADLKGVSAME